FTFRPRSKPFIQFNRMNFAEPFLLRTDHVAEVCPGFNQHTQIKITRKLGDRSLLHQVRNLRPRRTAQPPPGILPVHGKSFIGIEEEPVAERFVGCVGHGGEIASALAAREALLKFVNLRCENKIALSQAVNLVRPCRDVRFTPRKQNIRMVPLLLRNSSDFVDERQSLYKIWKFKFPRDVVPIYHFPSRHLARQCFQVSACKWCNIAAERHACLARNVCHGMNPPSIFWSRRLYRNADVRGKAWVAW